MERQRRKDGHPGGERFEVMDSEGGRQTERTSAMDGEWSRSWEGNLGGTGAAGKRSAGEFDDDRLQPEGAL